MHIESLPTQEHDKHAPESFRRDYRSRVVGCAPSTDINTGSAPSRPYGIKNRSPVWSVARWAYTDLLHIFAEKWIVTI